MKVFFLLLDKCYLHGIFFQNKTQTFFVLAVPKFSWQFHFIKFQFWGNFISGNTLYYGHNCFSSGIHFPQEQHEISFETDAIILYKYLSHIDFLKKSMKKIATYY